MREILGDEVELAHTLRLEELRLPHDVIERERAVFPAHQRDRAERASVVAPFADFEIANVAQPAGKESDTRMHRRHLIGAKQTALLELGDEAIDFGRTEKEVDFGQRLD